MAAHIETGTMLAPSNYQSQVLKHLGLVAGMVDELGLVERIDQLLPKDEERRTLSHGQVVKAMIINGLGFNSACTLPVLAFLSGQTGCTFDW